MLAAPLPKDEDKRIAALHRAGILDTDPEESFDRITRMAQRLFNTRIALVSLVDRDRQWFKSTAGLDATETPRNSAFCAYAILSEDITIVEDAVLDDRFVHNPLVHGEPNIRFYAGAPLRTRDGFSLGTLCVIDDKPRTFLTEDLQLMGDLARLVINEIELRAAAKTSRELANRDHLTDAFNVRAFEQLFKSECQRSQRYNRPLCLAMLDLDHFKSINDTFGHAVGDLVIKSFAECCRGLIREQDVFARIGGEEFALFLPETRLADAQTVMQRLIDIVTQDRVSAENGTIAYTVSIGLSEFKSGAFPIEDLRSRADKMLYRAKAEGRNRLVTEGSDPIVGLSWADTLAVNGLKVSTYLCCTEEDLAAAKG